MKTRKTKQSQIDELQAELKVANSITVIDKQVINAKIETINNWSKQDAERRAEFAKAFNWKDGNGYNAAYKVPSWPEIFVHIGKLLNRNDLEAITGTIEGLRTDLNRIGMDVFSLQNPTQS